VNVEEGGRGMGNRREILFRVGLLYVFKRPFLSASIWVKTGQQTVA